MDLLAPPEWDRLLSAAQKNQAAEVRRLIREENVNPSHANRVAQSALHIAALWGNVEALEALLEHNASVNVQNSMTGATPLHCAVQSGKGPWNRRTQAMEQLMIHGADLSLCDFFGRTPADYCEELGQLDWAKRLRPQQPALFQALERGQVAEVKAILQESKDDNNSTENPIQQEYLGHTPFIFVLNLLLDNKDDEEKNQNEQVAENTETLVEQLELLLEFGADPNAVPGGNTPTGTQVLDVPVYPPLHRVCTALEEAYKNSDNDNAHVVLLEKTARLLKQYHATVTPDLHQLLLTACRKNELKFAKLLIEVIHINPNVQGRQGMTPIQFAARSGNLEMVQYLLAQPNIDIAIQDDQGKTALDAARVNDKQHIVALLENFPQTG